MSAAGPGEAGQGLSQVGRGAKVSGRLEGTGVVIVRGRLGGELNLEGQLIIAKGGRLEELRARSSGLRVEGHADGELRVEGAAEIAAGGSVTGSLAARRLTTAEGCRVDAELKVTPPPRLDEAPSR